VLVSRGRSLTACCCVLALCGCRHFTPDRLPVRAPAGDPGLEAYRPAHGGWRLEIVPLAERSDRRREVCRFSFHALAHSEGDVRRVEGTLYRARGGAVGGRAPLLCLTPILAGAVDDYLACRFFAWWATEEGMSAFYLHQDQDVQTVERDSLRLEEVIRESIQDNIRALDLLSRLDGVDPESLGSIGISMGAIKNVALIAAEPRLKANVLCLGGADLPRVFATSRERRVVRYVEKRAAWDRITPRELALELATFLYAEPGRWAPAVGAERCLLFLGTLDDKVPYECGLDLWEKLGRPEAYFIPLGHYTGIAAAPFCARLMFRYFRGKFGEPLAGAWDA